MFTAVVLTESSNVQIKTWIIYNLTNHYYYSTGIVLNDCNNRSWVRALGTPFFLIFSQSFRLLTLVEKGSNVKHISAGLYLSRH